MVSINVNLQWTVGFREKKTPKPKIAGQNPPVSDVTREKTLLPDLAGNDIK